MMTMPVRWKLKQYLESYNITVYRFWKASGIAKGTAYRLANGDTRNLSADTLDATIRALRDLTGEVVEPNDIIEWTEE